MRFYKLRKKDSARFRIYDNLTVLPLSDNGICFIQAMYQKKNLWPSFFMDGLQLPQG